MSNAIRRWSHALDDTHTAPQAIEEGACRCRSKMVEAPRSGEYVAYADYEAERERWKARIEAKAAEYESHAERHQKMGMRYMAEGDGHAAAGALSSEAACHAKASLLRSLLTEEGNDDSRT